MKPGMYIFVRGRNGEDEIVPLRKIREKVWDDMIHGPKKSKKKVKDDIW